MLFVVLMELCFEKILEKCLPFGLALPAEEILTVVAIVSFSVAQNLFNFQLCCQELGWISRSPNELCHVAVV